MRNERQQNGGSVLKPLFRVWQNGPLARGSFSASFAANKLFAAAAVVVLAGCAGSSMVWDKLGATQADYNKDRYECEKDTRQSGYFGHGIIGAENMVDFFKQCMVARGYELVDPSAAGAHLKMD